MGLARSPENKTGLNEMITKNTPPCGEGPSGYIKAALNLRRMGKASHYSSAKKQGDEVNDDKGEGRSHGFKRAEGCDNWREKI
jgi:hypothetical protein